MRIIAVFLAAMMAFGIAVLVMGAFLFNTPTEISNPQVREYHLDGSIEAREMAEAIKPALRAEGLVNTEPFNRIGTIVVHRCGSEWVGVIGFAFVILVAFVTLVVVLMRKSITQRRKPPATARQGQDSTSALHELYELQEKMLSRVESLETILTAKRSTR